MSTTLNAVSAEQLNITLRVDPLGGPDLIRDYYTAAPALAPFFAGLPWDADAARRIAATVRAQFDATSLRAMAGAIRGTSDAARAKLDRIANGEGFFVTTGQQAGLFTGPVFTVYKTLTAIKLAAALEKTLGVPVAPLFWVAADDHDFVEVNHTFVVGADNDLHRLEITASEAVQRSMQRHVLGSEIGQAIERLAAVLPDNESAYQSLAMVREAYVSGRSMAESFAELLARIFAGHDLLITSSAHPVVKQLGARVIARELDRAEQHEALVRTQTGKLVAAGYHEQVVGRPGAANVLYEDEEGRDRLVREDGGWHLSRSKRRFTHAELLALLEQHPQRFSPNVLLRPIVASAVFPTLSYVGGPAEVSYFAQIGCLFDAHGVPMPLAHPRVSVEVIEYKVRKILDKFGLDSNTVRQPFDQLASQVVRDELPPAVTDTVSALRAQILNAYTTLVDATQAIDPTLKGPLDNLRNASHKALSDAEKKIVSHLKKKNAIGIEQLRKASVNLYPDGKPQERALSAISFLARHGTAFIDAVAAEVDIDLDRHAEAWQGVACD